MWSCEQCALPSPKPYIVIHCSAGDYGGLVLKWCSLVVKTLSNDHWKTIKVIGF